MKKEENKLIYGAIIGDYFGSSWEFTNHADEKPEDMQSLTFHDGGYTDDTVMTVAVAESLLNKKDVANTMREYAHTYRCQRGGYGGRFCQWLSNPYAKPYGSYGNGAGMRVSSVAYFATSEEECLALSDKVTEVSHNHPEGMKAARILSLAIYRPLHGSSKEELRELIERNYDVDLDLEELHRNYYHNETCQKSVPQAFYCLLTSTNFDDCLRRVCYIGGDADTVGAMARALAAAYYKEIPEYMIKQVKQALPHHFIEVLDSIPLHIEERKN
jgi:ADP-ribosylglycohydrolase